MAVNPPADPVAAPLEELLEEVTQLRDDLASYVLGGEGMMWSLPMVLEELCRILADCGRFAPEEPG